MYSYVLWVSIEIDGSEKSDGTKNNTNSGRYTFSFSFSFTFLCRIFFRSTKLWISLTQCQLNCTSTIDRHNKNDRNTVNEPADDCILQFTQRCPTRNGQIPKRNFYFALKWNCVWRNQIVIYYDALHFINAATNVRYSIFTFNLFQQFEFEPPIRMYI